MAISLAYQLAHGATGSIAHLPFLSAVIVAPGFTSVMAIAASVLIGELLARREGLKTLFNVAQHSLGCALAALVFLALGGSSLNPQELRPSVLPSVVAFAVFLSTNTCLVSGVVAVSQRRRFAAVWQQNTLNTIIYDILSLPAVFFFAFVYVRFGAIWALGLAFPILGLRQLYKTNWQLERINGELLQLMVAAIEARDPYTSGHSQRVAEYARIVADAAGLGTRATERVYTAAMVHDVGKIHEEFAPILRKPGRLTDSEFAVMKSHSEKGAALVGKVSQFRDLIPAVRGHHEAWDGSGYPDGLRTDQIPSWARVIALADTIDAMTTDRPYRQALHVDTVRAEIRAQAGRQFDPRIALELASERHWPTIEAAIWSNSASRKARPYTATIHVPRHSTEVGTVPA
ncbi:MAG TPA: HD-GYP domain-containing protein [Gemmatimonadaceae bacterium]|nr:HD-GYP domain-containing protein [Gemmatimonadaceae bacterium]